MQIKSFYVMLDGYPDVIWKVLRRSNDYHVSIETIPSIWDCGATVEEALEKWLKNHRGYFE